MITEQGTLFMVIWWISRGTSRNSTGLPALDYSPILDACMSFLV